MPSSGSLAAPTAFSSHHLNICAVHPTELPRRQGLVLPFFQPPEAQLASGSRTRSRRCGGSDRTRFRGNAARGLKQLSTGTPRCRGHPAPLRPGRAEVRIAPGASLLETDDEFNDGSRITTTTLTETQISNAATLAEAWGFLKYHYADVAAVRLSGASPSHSHPRRRRARAK